MGKYTVLTSLFRPGRQSVYEVPGYDKVKSGSVKTHSWNVMIISYSIAVTAATESTHKAEKEKDVRVNYGPPRKNLRVHTIEILDGIGIHERKGKSTSQQTE